MRIILVISLSILGFIFAAAQASENLVEPRDCEFDYDQLKVDFNRTTRIRTYTLNGLPFTGCAKQDIPDNDRYHLHFVKNGKLERELAYYYNGKKARDYHYKDGYAHGILELFYDDGSPYIREEYNYGKLHGSLKRWKNGQLAREASFWYGSKVWDKEYEVKPLPTGKTTPKKPDDC